MTDLNITTLSISGYAGNPLPNRFFRQEGARTLALLFPGLRYSCDMPLLFYPLKLLLERGAEVLQVRADYTLSGYQSVPPGERAAWLATDARAALDTARLQGNYKTLVLVGKSIGTIALASLVPHEQGAVAIWLTPLLGNPYVFAAAEGACSPALFIAGTADDLHHAPAFEKICLAKHAQVVLIEGGDHSLEIAGDFLASLKALVKVMEVIDEFLSRHGVL